MRDGLYQVTTSRLCAGFVVRDGRVTECAPILRKRIAYWQTIAVPVTPCAGMPQWSPTACGLTDRAPDYGSGTCGFDSCHAGNLDQTTGAHPGESPEAGTREGRGRDQPAS